MSFHYLNLMLKPWESKLCVKECFRDRITEVGQNLTSNAATKIEQMVGNSYKKAIKRKLIQSSCKTKRGREIKRQRVVLLEQSSTVKLFKQEFLIKIGTTTNLSHLFLTLDK
ncbi:hypothetical protein B566_EDAN016533 [Ephemera danica]|nr:hypothetical protein B566_EDAN016533 [Ephemera danica]